MGIPIFLAAAVALAFLALSPAYKAPAAEALPIPSLTIVKSCSPEAAVPGLVQYIFDITNNSGEGLDLVDVDDSVMGDITALFPVHLNDGQSATVFKSYITQESDPRPLVNVVTATYETGGKVEVQATDDCTVQIAHMTLTKTATFNPDGTTTLTFTITNDGNTPLRKFEVTDSELGDISDQFPFDLAVGETVVVQITIDGQVCNNTVTAVYESLPLSTTVTAQAECGEDEFSFLDIRQNNPDGTLFTDPDVTFDICSDDVVLAGCDPTSPTFELSAGNPSGLIALAPGIYTVCVVEPDGFVVDGPVCQAAVVPVSGSVSVVFITIPVGDGEGCTPGFWKSRKGQRLWDNAGDPISAALGAALGIGPVTTSSSFNTVFMLTPAESGFPNSFTMIDAAKQGGGGADKLARHGTAALLNAAGVNYPLSITDVKTQVQNAYLTNTFEPLATDLDIFNNLGCDIK